jgi:Helicase conserved C-terminal domain
LEYLVSDISAFYAARTAMVAALRAELIGGERDEVITEFPLSRFVTGILWPQSDNDSWTPSPDEERANPDSDDEASNPIDVLDTPVSLAHTRYPSAFGMSFSIGEDTHELVVQITAAQYEESLGNWRRKPLIAPPIRVPVVELGPHKVEIVDNLDLHVVIHRPRDGMRPVTLALVNRGIAPQGSYRDGYAWYQVGMTVKCESGFHERPIQPSSGLEDEDVESNRLLFRNARNLAIGHGCAVEWTDAPTVTELRMSFVPAHDVPRADTAIPSAPPLPMSVFAAGHGIELLTDVVVGYRIWISSQETRLPELADETLVRTARTHLARATEAADRIADGIAALGQDHSARRAFELMNSAMWEQRNKQEYIRSGSEPTEQYWRPFQIAFILMNLRGLTDPNHPERDLADLLWFPTGGGKTEAYLGLIGFVILLRRLRDPRHAGVSVIMRYTLRLLTLQQFERAAGLICALEILRRRELADASPITLGLWVGQAATPNNVQDAKKALNKLRQGEQLATENPMQLTRCPWCGAHLAPDDYVTRLSPVEELTIRCPNASCDFHAGLPAYVVDSDVYRVRPSLVIGTVDKFAMMAWRADAQAIFSADGQHPRPDLIVQDELHLISGPLGTMVGLYEAAVDAACSVGGHRPKLIASTATIRRAGQQVRSVFARETRQFPPPGLDVGDVFFSTEADPATTGPRQYVGVLAQGTSHTYLLVRTYAALLQAAQDLDVPEDVRDPYWTLIAYFNSLRVLGGAAMQVTDDVPDQMKVIATRGGKPERPLPDEPAELTSRAPSSEIPKRLAALAVPYGGATRPLDVLLATNMISVGLDVDRLGLMAVMGQPQATAEYIQATSRVGRLHPGLVVVIYNAARSRDLSHYEAFSSYHRALYRQVEPNSATPFAPRARDRGLHGCLVSMARTTDERLSPDIAAAAVENEPELLSPMTEAILSRARTVAPNEVEATRIQLERLVQAWAEAGSGGSLKYAGWQDPSGALLVQPDVVLRDSGAAPAFPVDLAPWATLTSLRDVDAQSSLYLIPDRKTR